LKQQIELFKESKLRNMMPKEQVKRLDRSDAIGQAKFIDSLFEIAA
jgi:hypothetical protein